MKVTRDNMENLRERMQAVADAWGELEEPIDTWLDEDTDREERTDARETIDQELETLLGAVNDVAALTPSKKIAP